ncbi:MAG: DUF4070 domain-containing protein [Candidatus Aureabacteria bacterium]|nr:DUF4070 domain-containing protein [Candidatus Auribacterota bacterium]
MISLSHSTFHVFIFNNQNRLLPSSWDNYTFFDVNFIPPKLSKEELQQGLLDIYQNIHTEEFYLKKINHFKEIHK